MKWPRARIRLKVTPRSSHTEFVGIDGDLVRIRWRQLPWMEQPTGAPALSWPNALQFPNRLYIWFRVWPADKVVMVSDVSLEHVCSAGSVVGSLGAPRLST